MLGENQVDPSKAVRFGKKKGLVEARRRNLHSNVQHLQTTGRKKRGVKVLAKEFERGKVREERRNLPFVPSRSIGKKKQGKNREAERFTFWRKKQGDYGKGEKKGGKGKRRRRGFYVLSN